MRYIKKYEAFNSILLNLSNNVDIELVDRIKSLINKGDSILEISCGNGADSIALSKDYNVVSTDTDQGYVDYTNSKGVECINHDTLKEFPFNDKNFNLIYSRLGLHYFSKYELISIFDELYRICDGYLLFTVKLVNDIPTGKVILTKKDWEDIVNNNFTILKSDVRNGILYDNESTWLEILAKV